MEPATEVEAQKWLSLLRPTWAGVYDGLGRPSYKIHSLPANCLGEEKPGQMIKDRGCKAKRIDAIEHTGMAKHK